MCFSGKPFMVASSRTVKSLVPEGCVDKLPLQVMVCLVGRLPSYGLLLRFITVSTLWNGKPGGIWDIASLIDVNGERCGLR